MCHIEPAAKVVGFLDQPQSRVLGDLLAMGGFVAVNAHSVQLVLHDLGRDFTEGVVIQQVNEGGLDGFGETEALIDAADHALRERAQLD